MRDLLRMSISIGILSILGYLGIVLTEQKEYNICFLIFLIMGLTIIKDEISKNIY